MRYEVKEKGSGVGSFRDEFRSDKHGHLIRRYHYGYHGMVHWGTVIVYKLEWTIAYRYNEEGLKIGELKRDKELNTLSETKFLYDQQGHLIEAITIVPSDPFKSMHSLYDASGREVESYVKGRNKVYRRKLMEYDEMGRLTILRTFCVDGSEKAMEQYRYDADGKITEFCRYDKGELVTKSIWVYTLFK